MSDDRLELKYIPLATLRRWDRNAKRHDLGGIAASIAQHGFKDPPKYEPALNGGEGGIGEGNGRADVLTAMRANAQPRPRGILDAGDDWLVPVLFGVDAESQAAAEAYAVDHNNLTMAGGDFTDLDMARMWEPEGYAALLEDLARQDMPPMSIDTSALDDLLTALREPLQVEAGNDAPVTVDETKPTRTQPGDVWRVGRHLVACLDSTDAEAVQRLVAGRRVGMVIADAPYGMNLDTSYSNSIDNPRKNIKASRGYTPVVGDDKPFNPNPWFELFKGVQEQFWWGADYYRQHLPEGGSWLVWDKRASVEEVEYSSSSFELCWSRTPHRRDILRIPWFGIIGMEQEGGRRVHPTQKPVRLYSLLIEHSAADDLILDPFLGSGPSIKAAEQMGRTVIGFELSPAYVDHILEWAEANGLTVELAEP